VTLFVCNCVNEVGIPPFPARLCQMDGPDVFIIGIVRCLRRLLVPIWQSLCFKFSPVQWFFRCLEKAISPEQTISMPPHMVRTGI
jgi:hypothetical protein